jgi:radical SAM superfamily enzyme YgiQ (UPF0313 family)
MYKKAVLIASAILTIERPPPALAVLSGICEHNNIDYDIFDLNIFLLEKFGAERWEKIANIFASLSEINHDDKELISEVNQALDLAVTTVLNYTPDLISVSSFSVMQIPWTRRFLEKLRGRTNAIIIAGGPGISYEQETSTTAGKILAKNNLLDYYVLGEGDKSFDEFLKGNITLGVNHKDSKFENWVPQIDNLDSVILPTYKKINYSWYRSQLADSAPEIAITGSRGCVRNCTFCDVAHNWKKFRFRSAKSIVDEMVKHYHEVKCLNYFFTDSLINGSMKQFIEVMESLIKLQNSLPDLKKLKYSGQFIIRPKQHHPEHVFQLLSDSGCDRLEIGIESGSERVREHIGKKFSNDDIDHHLSMSEKYKIKNHILMFTAYPTETLADHQETINFFKRNQKYLINNTIIGTNLNSPVQILKNTPLDRMRDDLGIEIFNMEYANMSNWVSKTNPELTLAERWRRYIELVKLTTKLKYKRATLDLTLIDLNIADLQKMNKLTQQGKLKNEC